MGNIAFYAMLIRRQHQSAQLRSQILSFGFPVLVVYYLQLLYQKVDISRLPLLLDKLVKVQPDRITGDSFLAIGLKHKY